MKSQLLFYEINAKLFTTYSLYFGCNNAAVSEPCRIRPEGKSSFGH